MLEKIKEYNDAMLKVARTLPATLAYLNLADKIVPHTDQNLREFLLSRNGVISKDDLASIQITYATDDIRDKLDKHRDALKDLEDTYAHYDHPAITFLNGKRQVLRNRIHIMRYPDSDVLTDLTARYSGTPDTKVNGVSILQAARNIFLYEGYFKPSPANSEPITASHFMEALQTLVKEQCSTLGVTFELDPTMSARISVTTQNNDDVPILVKIRTSAIFYLADLHKLLHHELFIHAGTIHNSVKQTTLTMLGHASMDTTTLQEGMAAISESIPQEGVLDYGRQKLWAHRIIAIHHAEQGADLIDLYNYFLNDAHYSQEEAVSSALRILRGGNPANIAYKNSAGKMYRAINYKDNAYLHGMMRFITWMEEHPAHDHHVLFAGKISLNDADLVKELMRMGIVDAPDFLPPLYYKMCEGFTPTVEDLKGNKIPFSRLLAGDIPV